MRTAAEFDLKLYPKVCVISATATAQWNRGEAVTLPFAQRVP
jgi:hypothetical protein